MKKVILVAVVVIAGLSTSCKKSYTCNCSNGTSYSIFANSSTDANSQCAVKSSSNGACYIQ